MFEACLVGTYTVITCGNVGEARSECKRFPIAGRVESRARFLPVLPRGAAAPLPLRDAATQTSDVEPQMVECGYHELPRR